MKRLLKNIKINLFFVLVFALSSNSAIAGFVAHVEKVNGQVFQLENEKIRSLNVGDQVNDFSKIMTEENSSITLVYFTQAKLHLSGGTQVKLLRDIVEIQNGYVWVDTNGADRFNVQTANANAVIKNGEGIVSFIGTTGKTQVVTLTGIVKFSNIEASLQHNFVELKAGQFSLIDSNYHEGMPRIPTNIGEKSFQLVTGLFPNKSKSSTKGIYPQKEIKRTIASTHNESVGKWNIGKAYKELNATKNKASLDHSKSKFIPTITPKNTARPVYKKANNNDSEIIIIRRKPAVVRGPSSFNASKFYKKEVKKIKRRKIRKRPWTYSKKSNVNIKVFGVSRSAKYESMSGEDPEMRWNQKWKSKVTKSRFHKPKKSKSRKPASLDRTLSNSQKVPKYMKEFNSSVMDQYKKQMRHKKEMNHLINDLESIKMDYSEGY